MNERKVVTIKDIGRSQHGFSLIEIMISMVILSVGILSIVGIQYHIVNGTTSSNVVTQQLNLAQRIMEQYKNIDNPSKLNNKNLVNVDHEGEAGGPYNVAVTVENITGDTAKVSRLINVTVTRNGGIGGHPLTLRSVTRGNGV